MKNRKEQALPVLVYVTREKHGADSYLLVTDTVDELKDGATVGTYELRDSSIVVVHTELR